MKAVLLQGYGSVDKIAWDDVEEPSPAPGEYRVRVSASSVNPIDYKLREGLLQQEFPVPLPYILGWDLSGVVETAPSGAPFQPGDNVFALATRTHATYAIVKPEEIARVPAGLDIQTAGVLPLVLLTGSQLISEGTQVKTGQTVLITGAVGSVGRTAVYTAKQAGAKVIAGVRGKQKEQASALQADEVVALDSADDLSRLSPVDIVADTVGGPVLSQAAALVRKGGLVVSVAGGDLKPSSDFEYRFYSCHPDSPLLERLAAAVHRGEFDIPLRETLPFSEIREAHRLAQAGGSGKIQLVA